MRFYKIGPAVIATFVGVGVASATAVSAEEAGPAKSQATVEIQPGDTTKPVDPIDPTDPPTGQIGNLTIDHVSSLDFGSFQLQSGSVTLTANQDSEKDPNVQVTDKRGTGDGWTLTVAQTQEFKSAEGHTLAGAKLTLPAGNLLTNNVNNKDNAPSTKSVVVNAEPNVVMVAAKNQGLGTWADQFARENTTLEIPSGNFAGSYESELTWTLSNAPQE
ncbi:WxL domain-containing protein [Bacillus pseudomycoides]|uniref:WxL domain-containing protein n=1 Tax=Bacillus bingmayongensis TaxID=1150157 RepID=A0ABU5JSH7_9BACI|nr:WxL domain-containing protein [Bacillus pseudomycoides]